jgi:hypothetical protein
MSMENFFPKLSLYEHNTGGVLFLSTTNDTFVGSDDPILIHEKNEINYQKNRGPYFSTCSEEKIASLEPRNPKRHMEKYEGRQSC